VRRATPLVVLVPLMLAGCSDRMVPYTNEAGGFTVLLPGTPEVTTTKNKEGHDVPTVVLNERSGTYTISWQVPKAQGTESADAKLDTASKGMAEIINGLDHGFKAIKLGEWPGREIIIEIPTKQTWLRVRLYMVGDRLYNVITSGSRWWVDSAEARRFHDSFRLTK
jgi:hypothetical protein